MTDIDLSDVENGDRLTITLESGETFEEALVVGADKDIAEFSYDTTFLRFPIEGDWWEQVNDRVESEVLELIQQSGRGGDPLCAPEVTGHIWVGEPKEASEPEYVTLGTVSEIERDP